jgi:hypothetical protein
MRRLVNDVMRTWAPPKKETPREELVRRLHDAYDAGDSTMRAFRDSGDVADILDQWGKVLDKCRLVVDAIEAHRGTVEAGLVLNRFNDFWDYDLKPIWSAIDRAAAEA